MTRIKRIAVVLCSLALLIGVCLTMANKSAQSGSSRGTPIDPLMEQVKQIQTNLGSQTKFVSGSMLNALKVAQHWNTLKAGVGKTTPRRA
jgi:flagellar basal body-associated protein FliL